MQRDDRVQVHLILIASLRDEADELMATLPSGKYGFLATNTCRILTITFGHSSGRCHACMDSALLPAVIRKILTAE